MTRSAPFAVLPMLLFALGGAPARAAFSGDLAFTPDECKSAGECILKDALIFVDPRDEIWRAEPGDLTDGASIPAWAQEIIGGPWDESYLKAAIVHDHYCNNHVRSWRDTHLMFYDALIDLGVGEFKAKLMYYAVYVGGPRWVDLLAPVDCPASSGEACAKGAALKVVGVASRPAMYGAMDMDGEMKAAKAYMAIRPDASLRDLEAMAQARRPGDMFDRLGGGVLQDRAAIRGVR